jgi:hypothetical protein
MKRHVAGAKFHTEIHEDDVHITYHEDTDSYSIGKGFGNMNTSIVSFRYGIILTYNDDNQAVDLLIPYISNVFEVVSDIARMFYDYGFFPSYKKALTVLVKNYEYIDSLKNDN